MRTNILAITLVGLAMCGCSKNDTTPPVSNEAPLSETKDADVQGAGDPKTADDLPTGHSTPEGAACDLARAFINQDKDLFQETCIPKFGGGESATKYETFLAKTSSSIETESKKENATPSGPARITTVFVARHLTKNGPASYGYATHNFHDVMFVDVDVELHNGQTFSNRTLVLKTSDGNWYVHPNPASHPLLSHGLNSESESDNKFTGQSGAPADSGG